MDEIYSVSWSSHQEGENKSACLFRFGLVSGKGALSFRSDGKKERVRSQNFKNPTSTQSCLESMENQLSWVEYFPKIHIYWDSSRDHCIVNSNEVRDYAKRFRRRHWSILCPEHEEKWHGTYSHEPEAKWDNEAGQMIEHIAGSGHPIFRGTSALNRGIVSIQGVTNTIHFSAESRKHWIFVSHHSLGKFAQYLRSSIEVVWCVSWTDAWADIHGSGQVHLKRKWTVNEISGSARSWFFGTKPKEDRGSLGKLLAWSLTTIRDARSQRTISYKLWISWIHKSLCWNVLQNRWWCERWTWKYHSIMQRVFTTSWTSRLCGQALVTKTSEIGPVLDVKTFCYPDKHGIEIQIPSTSRDNTSVWVAICRGPNRYVDELRYKNPESSPERPEEAGYGKKQEIHAERPTIQSRSFCSSSDDYIPNPERKWEDITANKYSHKHDLGHQISKFVGKLFRHEHRLDREADGAIHWRLIRQKLKFTFTRQAPSLIKIGSIISGRVAAKHDFSTVRILAALYCAFELLKDTLEKIWSNQSWSVM